MKKGAFLILVTFKILLMAELCYGQAQVIDPGWHHIRNAGEREWSEFPEKAESTKLHLSFSSHPSQTEQTLSIRQYDVKLNWRVTLNGKVIGRLVEDEKDLLCYLAVPSGLLRDTNTLEISTADSKGDDIRVGEITLRPDPLVSLLGEGQIAIEVFDGESKQRLPSRITIVNGRGILQSASIQIGSLNSAPGGAVALRAGHIYSATGKVTLGLPPGTYTLYATRGFEYGVDSAQVVVESRGKLQQQFTIKREVNTTGWVSSDTHIHTTTWSGHGDATAAERVITLAGEGIELPIITDHNIHVDLKPFAVSQGVDRYFTLVNGNEVTTKVGHFNIFPIAGDKAVNHQATDWSSLSEAMKSETPQAVILNHARDIHLGFRPFDPSKHLSRAGMRLDGWDFPANAMEVINSGSQQTDQMELTRDWFGMLNGGYFITPAGSSDSHDVSRFIVGQARTYIRCNDEDPGNLDTEEAVRNFIEGNVMVSFGLMAEIEINDAYGPGELAPASDEVRISVIVSGPSWIRGDRVVLYANGKKIREAEIVGQKKGGVKWSGDWSITMPPHDLFLVAIAEGASGSLPFWPIAKPFQPVSPEWHPRVFGLSGAVWLDGDRNGERNSARHYARTLVRQAGSDLNVLMQSLAAFDESVSIQAAALLHQNRKNLGGPEVTNALRNATAETRSAFEHVKQELARNK